LNTVYFGQIDARADDHPHPSFDAICSRGESHGEEMPANPTPHSVSLAHTLRSQVISRYYSTVGGILNNPSKNG
jgi:hypothetical protein